MDIKKIETFHQLNARLERERRETASPGLRIIPTGDANFWRLMEGDRWIAVIQFNGEMLEARQIEICRQFVASEKMLGVCQMIEAALAVGNGINRRSQPIGGKTYISMLRAVIAKATGVKS